MSQQYFVKRGEQVFGPCPIDEVKLNFASGKLGSGDLVGSSSDGPWSSAEEAISGAKKVLPLSALGGTEGEVRDASKLASDLRAEYEKKLIDSAPDWLHYVAGLPALIGLLVAIKGFTSGEWGIAAIGVVVILACGGAYAYFEDRRKEKVTKYSDALLVDAIEGLRNKEKSDAVKAWRGWLGFAGFAGLCGLVLAVNPEARSVANRFISGALNPAKCKIVSSTSRMASFVVDGKADYGLIVSARLANNGDTGTVTVSGELSTAEGTFSKERKVHLAKGATEEVELQFPEPTVNSTMSSAEYGLRCF